MTENAFTDTRDGQTYKTIEYNGLVWMTENLNFAVEGSRWYQEKETYGQEFGRLYTWEAALEACPPGWRLPTVEERQSLIDSFGGMDDGYDALIEGGESGMNFLLAGYLDSNGKFGRVGAYGGYWTGAEKNEDRALGVNFDGYYDKLDLSDSLKASYKSCRCVKVT
jgi:uncharacterized protein (TIGR02145 family)